MPTLRTLAESDLPAVATLFERVYPEYRWNSREAFQAYCRVVLFGNPWRDLELPSWIAEEDGRVTGMMAVVPRSMTFRGRPVRVAVTCQFMVDPDRRNSLTALQLMKKVASGPQDLTLADGANDLARRMWTGVGAIAPPMYNLHWLRPLRPARYGLALLKERGTLPRPLSIPARPLAAAADSFAVRLGPNRFLREKNDLMEHPLDPGTMVEHLPELMNGHALQPHYDMRVLPWLIDQTSRKARHGRLRSRAVRDNRRQLLGWYLYYTNPGEVNEVVQISARKGAFDKVLERLLVDAWRQGAVAVRGRLEAEHVKEFSERLCWFRHEPPNTVVYSRDPELMAAIQAGDAVLGRLEGEWWLRFQGG
jgi:hypothetical protein